MAKDKSDQKQMGYDEAGPKNKRKPEEKYNPSRLSNIADKDEQDPVSHKYKQDNFKDVRKNDNPSDT
ncbi:hypothetical protein [Thalassobacillus devorans]|uniref:hypothetical protein n=1 Tax=Thalassobacillus devorans TaxID=279813 RepID=UPI000A1CE503|nr:hypothetical protein [Thalassobacillus devorans]